MTEHYRREAAPLAITTLQLRQLPPECACSRTQSNLTGNWLLIHADRCPLHFDPRSGPRPIVMWRREAQDAADRWLNGPDEADSPAAYIEGLMLPQRADYIGALFWRQDVRAAWRRAWLRHPLKSARAALWWQWHKARSRHA